MEGTPVTAHQVRIPDRIIGRYPHAAAPPGHHTDVEIRALMTLLRAAGARRIAIGHGRHCTSIAEAAAINAAWTGIGGAVEQTVSWPVDAASWLRPARRLVAGAPDAWVIADNPAGWAQLATRLAEHLTDMTGAAADGGYWRIVGRSLIMQDRPESCRTGTPAAPTTPSDNPTPPADVRLGSGDAFVFGLASRFAYHGVPKLFPATAPAACGIAGGRLNITVRATGLLEG